MRGPRARVYIHVMQLPVTRLVFLLIPRGSQRKRTGVGYVAPCIVGNISRLNHRPREPPSIAFEIRSLSPPLFISILIFHLSNEIFEKEREKNGSLNRKRWCVIVVVGLPMVAPISAAGRIRAGILIVPPKITQPYLAG